MSEADTRSAPTRGRSSTRGRGGFSRGGPRGGRKYVNGNADDSLAAEDSFEDQGELGEMKKKYLNELNMLKPMFPDWTDVDLVFALQETSGDVGDTIDRITQGNVSQFAEVKKTKDRARSKVKEDAATTGATDKAGLGTRGGRGRGGLESSRGGRGRASDRGRGGHRGGRGGHATANGTAKDTAAAASIPTAESSAWDTTTNAATGKTAGEGLTADAAKEASEGAKSAWANVVTAESTPAAASEGAKPSLLPEGPPKKTWANILKPSPAPVPVPVPIKKAPQQAPPAEPVAASNAAPPPAPEPVVETKEPEPVPPAPAIAEAQLEPVTEAPVVDEADLKPSKVPLTEENVEHLPDDSVAPSSQTVASTTGSLDPRHATPIPAVPVSGTRAALGGYAASANRLAGTSGRSASFQRRVQEQLEAVVMPGHNAVDRAAVQFGSMGLNGEPGPDVDDEREEPETRQAPQHSPPSQPRTSLPPIPKQPSAPQEVAQHEAVPTPKQAPGLPPASAQNQQQIQQDPTLSQALPQEAQVNQSYNQFARYGQPGIQQEPGAQQQKPHDPFSHQTQQGHYEQYGGHNQQAPQQQTQSGFGGLSSAPSDYSSYYTSDQSRTAYNQYYNNSFGPQDGRTQVGHGQQDPTIGQQRSTSGFGAGPNDTGFVSQSQQQSQSRFGEAPGSGNNTPNPIMGGQQSGPNAHQSQHSMHQHQSHQHQQQGGYAGGGGSGFPYGHAYYNSPYPQAYQNQFGFSHQIGGYQGGYPSKQGGMYGAPHGYGMGNQSSYDQHSSSPASTGAFGQSQQNSMRSTSNMGSGLSSLDEYNRGSQTGSHQQGTGFGGISDPFARSASGFGGQVGYGQQGLSSGPEDALKPFGDGKGGPSPALGQPGRPGSAANSASGQNQTGLPPPQSHQSGFGGGYSSFPGQGNQYGGLGGLGSHQQGQSGMGGQSAYGSYTGGFNQGYGNYGASRGGWGQNYGTH